MTLSGTVCEEILSFGRKPDVGTGAAAFQVQPQCRGTLMDRNTNTLTATDLWTYRDASSWTKTDIGGFKVEALDGSIGSVDEATYEAGGSYIVVDTGPWIFGKKVLLPAGVVQRVDFDESIVWVNRTKAQIDHGPEFDEAAYRDPAYRNEVGTYYGEGPGYRDW